VKSKFRKLRRKKLTTFDIFIFLVLTLYMFIIIYPFYNAVLISLVSPTEYAKNPLMLIPKNLTFEAYDYILSGTRIVIGYKNTLLILLIGLPYNLLLTLTAAYVLASKKFPGKGFIVFFIYFTMFFSGGVIPTYLLVKTLGLTNTLWSVILVYGANTFYLIITRNYFESIPDSIAESARIDGANDITILFKIMIPLAKPIVATIFLFYAVDRWNEWFNAMLYIKDGKLMPLQLILRNIVANALSNVTSDSSMQPKTFSDNIKMACIVVTMLPVMILYPFVQKYFVQGIMVGAVKS